LDGAKRHIDELHPGQVGGEGKGKVFAAVGGSVLFPGEVSGCLVAAKDQAEGMEFAVGVDKVAGVHGEELAPWDLKPGLLADLADHGCLGILAEVDPAPGQGPISGKVGD